MFADDLDMLARGARIMQDHVIGRHIGVFARHISQRGHRIRYRCGGQIGFGFRAEDRRDRSFTVTTVSAGRHTAPADVEQADHCAGQRDCECEGQAPDREAVVPVDRGDIVAAPCAKTERITEDARMSDDAGNRKRDDHRAEGSDQRHAVYGRQVEPVMQREQEFGPGVFLGHDDRSIGVDMEGLRVGGDGGPRQCLGGGCT